MNFFSFATRTILLSFAVALFWLPVLGVTFYGIYMLLELMQGELIGLIMIVSLLYYPLQMLLLVLAVRGGMTVLKVTSGSDIAKLGLVAWHVLRFNGLISVIIVNLFGFAVAITGLKIMKPGYIEEFWHNMKYGGIARDYLIEQQYLEFPMMLALGNTFGLCLAIGIFAVNFAGQAAMAVDNPPRHHQLWGIGGQFWNVFILAMIFLFIPHFAAIYYAGGFTTTIADMYEKPVAQIVTGAYGLWTICLMAAASAQAYKLYLVEDDTRRTRDIEAMAGSAQEARPAVDLASLRKARMGGVVINPYEMDDDKEEEE